MTSPQTAVNAVSHIPSVDTLHALMLLAWYEYKANRMSGKSVFLKTLIFSITSLQPFEITRNLVPVCHHSLAILAATPAGTKANGRNAQ